MYAANSSILYSKEKTGRILGTWHQYLGRFPFVRTDRSAHSHRNKNFNFDKN